MIIDTDILISILRGQNGNYSHIAKAEIRYISIITEMELLRGAKNKRDFAIIQKFIKQFRLEILPLNEKISYQAVAMIENHFLSHNLQIPDALIAATALENDLPLVTLNYKDFKMIKGLELVKP